MDVIYPLDHNIDHSLVGLKILVIPRVSVLAFRPFSHKPGAFGLGKFDHDLTATSPGIMV